MKEGTQFSRFPRLGSLISSVGDRRVRDTLHTGPPIERLDERHTLIRFLFLDLFIPYLLPPLFLPRPHVE